MEQVFYWVWMAEALAKGSPAANRLLEQYESPQEIYEISQSGKEIPGISPAVRQALKRTSLARAEKIVKDCARLKIQIITQADEKFPESLKVVYGTPPVLYLLGDPGDLNADPMIGVVGTRKSSPLGEAVTGNLCYDLAKAGITVVSGCAVGIDSFAHKGALKARGKTIAVLGCGLDVDYPAPNRALKANILKNGALISELPPGHKGAGTYFPVRNRILAGLSHSVLVTEAPKHSGALITAEHAMQQGKDVFCTPPLAYGQPQYAGVISFLRSGAIPVYDSSDILLEYYKWFPHKLDLEEALSAGKDQKKQSAAVAPHPLASEQQEPALQTVKPQLPDGVGDSAKLVYQAMNPGGRAEELSQASGLEISETLAALTELELIGAVSLEAGGVYRVVPK